MFKRIQLILQICTITCMVSIGYAQTDGSLKLWDSPAGLKDDVLSHNIGDNQFQDIENVFTDGGQLEVVNGIYKIWGSTGSIRFLDEYTKQSGERYAIWVSSLYLSATKTAGTFTTIIATMNVTSKIWGFQFYDLYYLGGYKDDRWYYDGTTLINSTVVPQAKFGILGWNRGIFANTNASGQHSRVQYSKIVDGTTITDLHALDAFPGDYYIHIQRDDGEEITGLKLYNDEVMVFKPHSIHKVTGLNTDTNEDDDSVPISNEIGCIGGNILEHNGNLYWVSEYGLVEYNGTTYKLITSDIKSILLNIQEIKSSNKILVDTTADDFSKGTLQYNTSTTTVNNSVSQIYTSTFVHIQNTVTNSETYFRTASHASLYGGTPFCQTWTSTTNAIMTGVTLKLSWSNWAGELPSPFDLVGLNVCDISSNTLVSTYIMQPSSNSFVDFPLISPLLISSGTQYLINIKTLEGNAGQFCTYKYNSTSVYGGGANNAGGDAVFKIWVSSYPEYTSNTKKAQNDTETWQQWDKLSLNGVGDNNINIYYRTGNTTTEASAKNWTSIINNTVITSTVGPIIQYDIVFTTPSSRLDDISINYYVSNSPDTLTLSSDKVNNRIFLGCTLYPSIIPNTILCYQVNNTAFTKITGLNITAMTYYKFEPYWGDNNGNIYRVSPDYTDFNGTAIVPFIKTKDFNFGERLADKTLTDLWIDLEPTAIYSNATVEYFINKSTSASTTATVSLATSGLYKSNTIITKLMKDPGRFRYINFKIKNFDILNGLDFNFKYMPKR